MRKASKKRRKSNGNYMMYMMLAPSCCKLLFSLAPSPLPCPFRALSLLFFWSALSFNLLHEKCFIVARATASTNLAAFNKLWLHCPCPPFCSLLWPPPGILLACCSYCPLLPWLLVVAFSVFHLRLRIESSCRVSGVRCVFVATPAKFFPPENAASVTLFFRSLSLFLSLSLALLCLSVVYKFSIAHNAEQKGKIIGHKKCHSNAKREKK